MKFKSPDGRVFDGLIKAVENYCNGKCADCKLCAFCTYPMEDWIANVERDDTYKICKIMGYEVIVDKKACENCMFFEGDNTCNISGEKMRIAPVKICSMWEPKDELQQNCESIANDSNQEAKADSGKPRPSLVQPALIRADMGVREYGCQKYHKPDNWRNVEASRYWDALLRHVLAAWDDWRAVDPESGLPHLHHIICNAGFLAQYMEEEQDGKDNQE